jgi:mannose-1-phosphate guanylyltransferase/mannose-6-phosphate isomerase
MKTALAPMAAANPPIIPVILCGGMGSRLWPMSRQKYPKQFLELNRQHASLLQETARRVKPARNMKRPLIVSNVEHRFLCADHMASAGFDRCDIMLEPEMRNTAPAITAAAMYIQSQYKHALMLVLPSDHIIRDEESFLRGVESASEAAMEGNLVTFGIAPEYAETGYGYIKRGDALESDGAYRISQFVEKPDTATAQGYLANGSYSWNSGMFLFPVDLFLDEVAAHEPKIYEACRASVENAEFEGQFITLEATSFAKAPRISVDYAVMERTESAAVIPLSCGWSDAGAWDSLWRIGDKDEQGNVKTGTIYADDVRNCYLRAEDGPPIAALGVEDLVVVSTRDAVLVSKKDRAQDVKQLLDKISLHDDALIDHHSRVYRPWGFYETIDLGNRHQVKHIQVKPGAKLSVQMHHHRAEHWVIVSGTARVQRDEEDLILTENQYVYIPLGAVHAIENIGRTPLDFVEVQCGSYLGEDDIVRFEDRYGRAKSN